MNPIIQKLKLKKAVLVDQMMMLTGVSDHFYLQLGKLEAEILIQEKKLIQETEIE